MIALLLNAALAAPACSDDPQVYLSADTVYLYDALPMLPLLGSDQGGDAGVMLPLRRCLHLGVRQHAYLETTYWDPGGREHGWELRTKTWVTAGTELSLGRRWQVGSHLAMGSASPARAAGPGVSAGVRQTDATSMGVEGSLPKSLDRVS